MKRTLGVVGSGILMLAMAASLVGCNKASSNAMTASSGTNMMSAGMSLVNQLGGMANVTKLADAFGLNIANSSVLSKVFDAGSITQTKAGLVNEIAKASGMAPPNAGADLLSTLSGKGLDASGVSELTGALSSAADQMKLGAPQKTAVLGLLSPITNQLLGNK